MIEKKIQFKIENEFEMNLVSKFQICDRYRSKFLKFGFSDDFLKPIKNRKHLRLSLNFKNIV